MRPDWLLKFLEVGARKSFFLRKCLEATESKIELDVSGSGAITF